MQPTTRMRLRRLLPLLLAAALLPVLSGCIAVIAGAGAAGTMAYVKGELETIVEHDYDTTVRASNDAIHSLQFAKVGEKRDGLACILTARTAADTKVVIRCERVGDSLTRLKIRVGLIGDQDTALSILDEIRKHFPQP